MKIEINIFHPSIIAQERIKRALDDNDEFVLADNLHACMIADFSEICLKDEDSILYIYKNIIECMDLLKRNESCVLLIGQSPPSILFSRYDESSFSVKIDSYGTVVYSTTMSKVEIIDSLTSIKVDIEDFCHLLPNHISNSLLHKLNDMKSRV